MLAVSAEVLLLHTRTSHVDNLLPCPIIADSDVLTAQQLMVDVGEGIYSSLRR